MRLKEITFILENCDMITIDGKYIGEFLIDNLSTKFQRTACNSIDKLDVCNTFFIEIHKNANIKYTQHSDKNNKIKKFERLLQNDITSIEFSFEENNYVYHYYLCWKDIGYTIKNQFSETYISDLGHLYIAVDKKLHLDNFVEIKNINDEEYINFHFGMLDIK